ncbi:MAG: indole-3-glycerol phosphate synthase TrpC [Planctomycetota bacterium]|jgi:indole-3-glycerol phosphate synthase
MPSDFLDQMAAASAARAEARKRELSEAELRARAGDCPPAGMPDLTNFALFAEVKLRSPAAGELNSDLSLGERARSYERAGAGMISVLTEPSRFDGHLDHLRQVVEAVSLPVMRKDFLVDPYQIIEARAAGASAVLLIASLFDADRLQEMLGTARELGLFVLLEVFAAEEIEALRPLLGERVLLGVNCRDLRSLEIDPRRFADFADVLAGEACAAESGMQTAADVARVAELGFSAALVGSALMQSNDPEQLITAMLKAGRKKTCHSPSRSVD